MSRQLLLACFGIAFLTGCGVADHAAPRNALPAQPSQRVREVVGERAVELLPAATRVEAFRIKRQPSDGADKSVQRIAGYEIIRRAKDQDQSFAAELGKALLDDRTYLWNAAKACEPMPGVAFRLITDRGSVNVIVCYECSMLLVVTQAADGAETAGQWKDFDPGRRRLVRLAKRAFTDDADIQKLEEDSDLPAFLAEPH